MEQKQKRVVRRPRTKKTMSTARKSEKVMKTTKRGMKMEMKTNIGGKEGRLT
jgi:hypothetical protein